MLHIANPQHSWNFTLLRKIGFTVRASQRKVLLAVQKISPTHSKAELLIRTNLKGVEEDYQHPKMIYSSGYNMELDVYVEDLKLAFEYQGEQHYRPIYGMGTDFEQQQRRDQEKRVACKQVIVGGSLGMLILVPSFTNVL